MKEFIIQVLEFTMANLKQRYRRTWAGFIWVVLNPLIMFGVQSMVFKKFLRLDVPNYFLFLVSGLLPWIFMTQTLTMTTPIYVSSAQLLKSFKLNPLVLVVAQVLDNLINFLFAFLVICIPILFMSDDVNKMGLIFMPLNLLILIVGTLSASMFLSVLNVFFRDTNFVLQFAISILFFMTPIFYPLSYIPQNYRWLVSINPFYYFIEPFRNSLVDFQMEMYLISLGKAGIAVVTVSLVTYIYWRRKKNEFYYHL